MMSVVDYEVLSRAVSHALRHEPAGYGLELDAHGRASVETLLAALQQSRPEWRTLSEDHLHLMVAVASRRRHEIRDGKIRALYGHSDGAGRILLEPKMPPEILFHGTDLRFAVGILDGGLYQMSRQHVHLTTDRDYALSVKHGRRAHVVVMSVRAREAFICRAVPFYEASEHVWLSDYVPPEFIDVEKKLNVLAKSKWKTEIQAALCAMGA